ncbi:MAG TPA: 3-oxoadipate enol-lactonase [Amaricoccus sp.]|nr:3-oxoadipate enol-lactonase [Amaricoccus sp.]
MQFATIDGNAIHHSHLPRAGGGPTLVFINSLGTDFRIWDRVAGDLAGQVPVLLYDKRGHGLSGAGTPPYSIAGHEADLAGLLDAVGIGEVVLCGLSIGGMIAQLFAATRPERVRALVLCDTAHRIGTAEFWNQRIAALEEAGIESIADGVLERWFTPAFRSGSPALHAGCRNMLIRQPLAGYAGSCAAVRDADLTGLVGRIAAPTLVLVGEQDGSTPPDLVRATAELIPGARFEVIADAGHIPCVEQPAALVDALRRFLREVNLLP